MKESWLLLAAVVSVLAVGEASTNRLTESPGPLARPVQGVEEAPPQQNLNAAIRAWDATYRAAVARGRWESLVEAGDAYRQIGEVAGSHRRFDAKAREIYLSALFRARQQESLDGVLRVAEAFAALGDRDVVEQCIRIADRLAAQDADAQADVRAFSARFAEQTSS